MLLRLCPYVLKESFKLNEYTHCYFAYLDLLGFKDIIKSKTCSEIVAIFNEAKTEYVIREIVDENTKIPVISPESIHYYVMSDSICIYIEDHIKYALPVLTFLCMYFQVRMLCLDSPVFVRGSIARGEIYADGSVLFGPVMVEAYLRAENLAHVPRVVIPASLIEEMTNRMESAMVNGFTHMEQDGFYANGYIDYFCNHNSTLNYRDSVYEYVNGMINGTFDQSLREKFMYVKTWMDYFRNQEEQAL